MAEITLRSAVWGDLALLKHWDEQPQVKEAIGEDDDDWHWEAELKRSPEWREFLVAEVAGRPIGFMQIIDPLLEDSHYWGEVGVGFGGMVYKGISGVGVTAGVADTGGISAEYLYLCDSWRWDV